MALSLFLKGLLIGFCIAAPVGPIGVLCIRRSLAGGFALGLATGLGAAVADAIYGGIAGFGLTAISMFLVGQQIWLGIIGGVFLIYLGIRAFMARPNDQAEDVKPMGLLSSIASTLFLTLTNPMTIISFGAVFVSWGLGSSPSYVGATGLVVGVFIGSALWWLVLSGSVSIFRSRLSPSAMGWVNRFSGLLITGFGIYALLRPLLRQ